MRSMNSSGTVATSTPVILAPPLEKLLTMHSRAKSSLQSYILAGEFHSTRKVFRRSRILQSPHGDRSQALKWPNVRRGLIKNRKCEQFIAAYGCLRVNGAVLKTRADRPQQFQNPTPCCA